MDYISFNSTKGIKIDTWLLNWVSFISPFPYHLAILLNGWLLFQLIQVPLSQGLYHVNIHSLATKAICPLLNYLTSLKSPNSGLFEIFQLRLEKNKSYLGKFIPPRAWSYFESHGNNLTSYFSPWSYSFRVRWIQGLIPAFTSFISFCLVNL